MTERADAMSEKTSKIDAINKFFAAYATYDLDGMRAVLSFRGLAAPNRFISRSSASARTALRPFLNSCGRSRNRRRNGDFGEILEKLVDVLR